MRLKNKVIILLACVGITLSLAGCGSSSSSSISTDSVSVNGITNTGDNWGGSPTEYHPKFEEKEIAKDIGIEDTNKNDTINQEKLVYKAEVNIEVKEFDKAIELLKDKIKSLDGILQYEEYYDDTPSIAYYEHKNSRQISGYKHFTTKVRIPTAKYSEFLTDLNNVGHIKSSNSQVENITQSYYNNTAYLKSYQNQLEVLQDMYKDAKTITEMLEIEDRISKVQAEISVLTTEIQSMDFDVEYSIISVTIDEVVEYSDTSKEKQELSFGQKVIERFKDSFNNFVHFLEAMVYITIDLIWLIIGIIILVALLLLYSKKHKQKLIKTGRITPDGKPIMPNQQIINNTENKK